MSSVTRLVQFSGRVQGIGFRFAAVHKAQELGLTGWVKNLPVRTEVEACVQGEEKKVQAFISYFKKNHGWIRVDTVRETEVSTSEKYTRFEVRY